MFESRLKAKLTSVQSGFKTQEFREETHHDVLCLNSPKSKESIHLYEHGYVYVICIRNIESKVQSGGETKAANKTG